MMKPQVSHPDAETTRVQIELADPGSEAALAEALGALLALTKKLEPLIRNPKALAADSKYSWYLVTTFPTPKKKTLSEREFFARCLEHPSLYDDMVRYSRNVNSRAQKIKGMETDLGHTDMRPAGSFAIVPLSLVHQRFIDPLMEHMLGTDMDHETFHASLIEALLARYGIVEETLRLLAFRAVDGMGQEGGTNLRLAYTQHGFDKALAKPGAIEAFAKRVDEQSERVPGPGKRGDGLRHSKRSMWPTRARRCSPASRQSSTAGSVTFANES